MFFHCQEQAYGCNLQDVINSNSLDAHTHTHICSFYLTYIVSIMHEDMSMKDKTSAYLINKIIFVSKVFFLNVMSNKVQISTIHKRQVAAVR